MKARVFSFLSLSPGAHFSGHDPMTLRLCTPSTKECFLRCSFMWAGQLGAMWQPTDTDMHSSVLSFLNSHFHHDQDEHDFPWLFKRLITDWSPSGRATLTFKDLIKDEKDEGHEHIISHTGSTGKYSLYRGNRWRHGSCWPSPHFSDFTDTVFVTPRNMFNTEHYREANLRQTKNGFTLTSCFVCEYSGFHYLRHVS